MADAADASDVVLNRYNLLQARSRKVLLSWLPADTSEERQVADEENDEDFKPMSEAGGIGSKRAYGDIDDSTKSPLSKRQASNDRLLEQLLGKKAANARKQAREAHKRVPAPKHTESKLTKDKFAPLQRGESDDDEGGRAAAFKSKRLQKPRLGEFRTEIIEDDPLSHGDDGHDIETADGGETTSAAGQIYAASPEVNVGPGGRAARKGPGSYLDELLAKKAGKKKKAKKNKDDSNS